MRPTVSVVMPCYNAARWLAPAIRSVLSQTAGDLELIAIDDGSTDTTRGVIAGFATQDPRVRLVALNENRGIVNALNAGLDMATGRYIARMDADDLCVPDRFQVQMQFLESARVDLCGSWFTEFGQGIRRTVRWPHESPAVHAAMLFQSALCHPSILARREVFDDLRYREDYRYAEDYDLFARAMRKHRLANVPRSLLDYRRHSGQATQARRDAMARVANRIRLEALDCAGIKATADEQRLHNLIRTPASITSIEDLHGIEVWLGKLIDRFDDRAAREIVASQWVRACVRAAPLGDAMWALFRGSALSAAMGAKRGASFDLRVLALLRLDYASRPFEALRRLGLSA